MKKLCSLLFLVVLINHGCMSSRQKNTVMDKIEYADGNGNVYTVTPKELIYVPVKPESSSSGIYSGGEPYTAPVRPEQFKELANLVNTCMEKKEGQILQRNMGSGKITLFPAHTSCIFEMSSSQKKEIEACLKKISGK